MLALEAAVRDRLAQFLAAGVAPNPRRVGKALEGRLKGFWRYKIGDYRIMCRIEDEHLKVVIVAVGHRDHIYKGVRLD